MLFVNEDGTYDLKRVGLIYGTLLTMIGSFFFLICSAFGDDDKVFEMDFKRRYMLGSIAKRVIDSGSFNNVSLTAMTNRLIGLGLITGISYQKSVMPEGINNGIPAYLTRLYRRLKKLIK